MKLDPAAAASFALTEVPQLLLLGELQLAVVLGELCHPTPGRVAFFEAHSEDWNAVGMCSSVFECLGFIGLRAVRYQYNKS